MTQLLDAPTSPDLASAPTDPALAARPAIVAGPVRSFIETTKPGITRLVTATSVVGLVMSGANRDWSVGELLVTGIGCIVGTALSASGANSINQYMERDRDAVMNRTMNRPLPSARISPGSVLVGGWSLAILGVAVLWMTCGFVPAAVSLACVISYVAWYTPLKTRTTLSTLVGAIPGALPPLIGWSAGSERVDWHSLIEPGAISLFILMCIWQIPHFLAIGWLYREDYAKGGYILLPVVDRDGRWTAMTIALWTAALLPATVLPAVVMPHLLSLPYATIAALSSLVFGILAWRLIATRERVQARQLFFGSILHLPLLLIAMVAEAVLRRFA